LVEVKIVLRKLLASVYVLGVTQDGGFLR